MAINKPDAAAPKVVLVDVKLKKPHTHGGVDYAPGDTITGMDKQSAEWLVREEVCEIVTGTTAGA